MAESASLFQIFVYPHGMVEREKWQNLNFLSSCKMESYPDPAANVPIPLTSLKISGY